MIGFVGAGGLGRAILDRLLADGHSILAFNRTRSRLPAHPILTMVKTPAEAASTGLVLSCVADDDALEGVVGSDSGILAGLPPDGIHVSLSTVRPATLANLATRHRERHSILVAGPILGRPAAVRAGQATCLVAGPMTAVTRVESLLHPFVARVVKIGPEPADAGRLKLAANLIAGSILFGLAEARAIIEQGGPNSGVQLAALVDAVLPVPMVRSYLASLESGCSEPGFPVRLARKDFDLLAETVGPDSKPRLSRTIHQVLRETMVSGEDDWCAAASAGASLRR
jgi:3-hydroxyisobutyrate dehydrogenase-like beta-hydroxyacid dehydrogenase